LTINYKYLQQLRTAGGKVLKLNFKKILTNFCTFCSDLQPFLLSHHPDCKFFRDHYFILGKFKICKGCILGIPAFFITTILFLTISTPLVVSQICIVLGILLIATNSVNVTQIPQKIPHIKVITKVCIGMGLSLILVGIFGLETYLIIKILLFLSMYGLINGTLGLYRINSIHNVCQACEYKADWKRCEGFREIYERLKQHGFIENNSKK